MNNFQVIFSSMEGGGYRLLVKKLSVNATVPTKGSEWSAGYDLYSAVSTILPPNSSSLVATDISIAIVPVEPLKQPIDEGFYGRIAPRSSLAVKFIDVGAGVVDYDYRGPIRIVMYNHNNVPFEIAKGDRIAQLIVERIIYPKVVVLSDGEELPVTTRGTGGFGSTGK